MSSVWSLSFLQTWRMLFHISQLPLQACVCRSDSKQACDECHYVLYSFQHTGFSPYLKRTKEGKMPNPSASDKKFLLKYPFVLIIVIPL